TPSPPARLVDISIGRFRFAAGCHPPRTSLRHPFRYSPGAGSPARQTWLHRSATRATETAGAPPTGGEGGAVPDGTPFPSGVGSAHGRHEPHARRVPRTRHSDECPGT